MRGCLIWLALAVLSAAVFTLWPGLDLWVSGLFWRAQDGFWLAHWAPFRWPYLILPPLTWILVAALALALGWVWLFERPLGPFDRNRLWYLLLNLAIGPGLLANTLLKDHWGRARPIQVTPFGGSAPFTPALIPADACGHNCSFVSGHGAMAFALIGFALLVGSPGWRRVALGAVGVFGAWVSLARIAQGGHFLSDTIFAALLMIAVAAGLHRWIVTDRGLEQPWVRSVGRGLVAGWRALRPLARVEASWHVLAVAAVVASILWVDQPLASLLAAPDDRLTRALRWLTGWGEGWVPMVPSALAWALLLLAARAPRYADRSDQLRAWARIPAWLFAAVGSAGLAADLIKILVGRGRPKLWLAHGIEAWGGPAWTSAHWSMPSGHTVNTAALAAALALVWPRHVAAYAILPLLIGVTRIGLDQHYLSDVLVGLWLGVMWVRLLTRVPPTRRLAEAVAARAVAAPPVGVQEPGSPGSASAGSGGG